MCIYKKIKFWNFNTTPTMIQRKHAIDVWAGSSLEASWSTLLQTQQASSSTDIWTNSTCTFDASSLEYTTFSFFPGNGMPVKEVRQKWSWHSLREGNCSRPNKMLQWPPGTQKTSFFPGLLLPEVTAKKLKMHPDSHYCSEWLGEWEMIQASLYCVKHLYMKSALEQS